MEKPAEMDVMWPQAKECQLPPEAGRAEGGSAPQGLQREPGPADT